MKIKASKREMKKPIDPKPNLKNKDFWISIRKQRLKNNGEKRPRTMGQSNGTIKKVTIYYPGQCLLLSHLLSHYCPTPNRLKASTIQHFWDNGTIKYH
jgi:hypothetical protein